jgi:hypothetical protein
MRTSDGGKDIFATHSHVFELMGTQDVRSAIIIADAMPHNEGSHKRQRLY